LNSDPGVQDGVFKHWIDGKLIIDMNSVPWIGDGGDINAKWNSVGIGGNDYYKFNLDESASIMERERWFAIDDFLVLDDFPVKPLPPSQVLAE